MLIALLSILAQNAPAVQAQQPALTETTTLRFVTSENVPIANDTVWLFCYADEQATSFLSEVLLTTDANGHPSQPLPSACPWIAVLHRQHEQPSGKSEHGPAYRVYATSWRTGSGTPVFDSPGCSYGVPNCAIARAVGGDIVIRKEWPLVLFNIVASLEWTPEAGSSYIKQLQIGLKQASLYLADLTDGYMAFGPVTIYTGGRNWDSADLRFQTANDLRPAAFMGGIVDSAQHYTAPISQRAAIFRPAATFYGRYWDGSNAHSGAWHLPDAYRTLVHEWAHYALFLYDEYGEKPSRVGTVPAYCMCDDLPKLHDPVATTVCSTVTRENGASAMAYHYTASELWHPIHGSPPNCANSDQGQFHGEPDWLTLAAWFKLQTLPPLVEMPSLTPPIAPIAGPPTPVNGPVADLFAQVDNYVQYMPNIRLPGPLTPTAVHTSTLHVQITDSNSPTDTVVTQLYLPQNDAQGRDRHILHQGTLTGASIGTPTGATLGSIDLWGITADDSLHVFVDRYQSASVPGGRFLYVSAPTVPVHTLHTVTAQPNAWGSSIDLVYSTTVASSATPGLLTGVTVVLSGAHNPEFEVLPRVQICVPDARLNCPSEWIKAMQMDSAGRWVATFTPLAGADELPLYGVVRIISPQRRTDGLIRWFRDAGGVGPGHKIGNMAPLRDGPVMVDNLEKPELAVECNRVMVMPAANYPALFSTIDAEKLVGTPLDLDILFGDAVAGECISSGIDELDEFPPLRLTLFYTDEAVQRLGITGESELHILQFLPLEKEWQAQASIVDTELNRISTRITQDGIFAIGWSP